MPCQFEPLDVGIPDLGQQAKIKKTKTLQSGCGGVHPESQHLGGGNREKVHDNQGINKQSQVAPRWGGKETSSQARWPVNPLPQQAPSWSQHSPAETLLHPCGQQEA